MRYVIDTNIWIYAACDTEIRGRIARYDTEGAHSVPAVEVFTELDRRLRR